MQVTLEVPDELARYLTDRQEQPDLSRALLEAAAIEAVRDHSISSGRAAEILGIGRYVMDGLLKRAGVYYDFTVEDIDRDVETLQKLGI